MLCGELADPIRVPRAREPYSRRVLGAFVFPLSRNALLAMLALGIFLRVLAFGGALGILVGQAVLWSYVFSLTRAGARGIDDVEPPDFTHVWDEIVVPLLLVAAVGLLLWAPALVLDGVFFGLVFVPDEPALRVLPVIGLLYLPMGLMVAATTGSILRAANPVVGLLFAVKLGGDYLTALALLFVLGFVYAGLSFVALAVSFLPFVGPVLGAMILSYPFLVLGRALGLLLQAHGAGLGYSSAAEDLVPALGDVQPRGPVLEIAPRARK